MIPIRHIHIQLIRRLQHHLISRPVSFCIRFPGRNGLQRNQRRRILISQNRIQRIALRHAVFPDLIHSAADAAVDHIKGRAEIKLRRVLKPGFFVRRKDRERTVFLDDRIGQLENIQQRVIIFIGAENIKEMPVSLFYIVAVDDIAPFVEGLKGLHRIPVLQDNVYGRHIIVCIRYCRDPQCQRIAVIQDIRLHRILQPDDEAVRVRGIRRFLLRSIFRRHRRCLMVLCHHRLQHCPLRCFSIFHRLRETQGALMLCQ